MYNSNKKNNLQLRAGATVLSLATILIVAGVSASLTVITTPLLLQPAEAQRFIDREDNLAAEPKAPVVVSGDNIYIAWWTNNTENGNEEVMFRASTDGGATFSNKTNLSNTTDADSWRVELHGEDDNVIVSWWETNQTSDIPVARISTDGGATFGPMLMLGMNGTIGATEEGEGGEEGTATFGEEGEG